MRRVDEPTYMHRRNQQCATITCRDRMILPKVADMQVLGIFLLSWWTAALGTEPLNSSEPYR